MDINELIDNLRMPSWHDLEDPDATLLGDAADALSTLQAENEKLRVEAEGMRSNWYKSVEEIKKLRAEVESLKKGHCAGCSIPAVKAEQIRDLTDAPKLRAELEQVKAERDEAVQCIRGIAKSGRVWMCPYCVHAKDTTGGIAECELDVGVCMMPYSKFEWDGQKED